MVVCHTGDPVDGEKSRGPPRCECPSRPSSIGRSDPELERELVTEWRHDMSRTTRTRCLLLGAVVATALAAAGGSLAAPANTVNGTVGPGFTIGLTIQGKKVTRLKAGTAYRFVISDRSSIHDFHLSGPGLNRVLTGVGYTGTKSFVLRLRKGTYHFQCDPHSSFMHGGFAVS
jgi:plastocyanin